MVAPMPPCTAMPTSASARAAASFTPSPTITTAPAPLALCHEAGDEVALLLRRQAAQGIVGRQAQLGAGPRDHVGVVAREDAHAHAARAAGPPRSARASGRSPSPMPATPAVRPSTATKHGAETVGAPSLPRRPREPAAPRDRASATKARVPTAHVVSVEPALNAASRHLDDLGRSWRTRCRRAPVDRWKARATWCDDSASRCARNCQGAIVTVPSGHRDSTLGQRAGLVEQHRVHVAQPFERIRVLDEDAGARRAHQRDRHRQRHRQAERARARHDQQRDHAGDRLLRTARTTRPAPAAAAATSSSAITKRRASTSVVLQQRRFARQRLLRRSPAARRPACRRRWHRRARSVAPRGWWRRRSPRRPRPPGSGAASPVSTALSSDERPASTTPSTGTSSPLRTSTRSPGISAASGTSITAASAPSPSRRRANSRKATPRRLSARSRASALRAALQLPGAQQGGDQHGQRVEPDRPAADDDVPRARRRRQSPWRRQSAGRCARCRRAGRPAAVWKNGRAEKPSTGTATSSDSQRKNVAKPATPCRSARRRRARPTRTSGSWRRPRPRRAGRAWRGPPTRRASWMREARCTCGV